MAGTYNVKVKINRGELVRGTFVAGESHGITDDKLETFDARWSGWYVGTEDHDNGVYHYFRDGEMNGNKQRYFGMPVSQFEIEE